MVCTLCFIIIFVALLVWLVLLKGSRQTFEVILFTYTIFLKVSYIFTF